MTAFWWNVWPWTWEDMIKVFLYHLINFSQTIHPVNESRNIHMYSSSWNSNDILEHQNSIKTISWVRKSLKCFKIISYLAFLISLQVTSVDLHRHFHALGAGIIEDVRVQRDKGFGFVRFSTHAEAALAIQMGNARILYGKPIKVHSLLEGYTFHHKNWHSFVIYLVIGWMRSQYD